MMNQFIVRNVASGKFCVDCATAEEAINIAIIWNKLAERHEGVENAYDVYDAMNDKVVWKGVTE